MSQSTPIVISAPPYIAKPIHHLPEPSRRPTTKAIGPTDAVIAHAKNNQCTRAGWASSTYRHGICRSMTL